MTQRRKLTEGEIAHVKITWPKGSTFEVWKVGGTIARFVLVARFTVTKVSPAGVVYAVPAGEPPHNAVRYGAQPMKVTLPGHEKRFLYDPERSCLEEVGALTGQAFTTKERPEWVRNVIWSGL